MDSTTMLDVLSGINSHFDTPLPYGFAALQPPPTVSSACRTVSGLVFYVLSSSSGRSSPVLGRRLVPGAGLTISLACTPNPPTGFRWMSPYGDHGFGVAFGTSQFLIHLPNVAFAILPRVGALFIDSQPGAKKLLPVLSIACVSSWTGSNSDPSDSVSDGRV